MKKYFKIIFLLPILFIFEYLQVLVFPQLLNEVLGCRKYINKRLEQIIEDDRNE